MTKQKKTKSNLLTPFLITGLIIFAGIAIVYFLTKTDVVKTLPKNEYLTKKIETYKDKLGETHTAVTGIKTNDKSQFYQAEIDQLKKQLGVKEDEIVAMTDLNARLVDSVKLAKISVDEANNKLWEWKKEYKSGSKVEAKMSEKDSVLQLTNVDIKVKTNETYERRLFRADKYSIDFFSPDQNIYFDGVRVYRKETIIKPKRLGIGFQMGYGLTESFKVQPYFGVGLSYNLLNF